MASTSTSTMTTSVILYNTASEFLEDTESYLNANERESNIVLAYALKYRAAETNALQSSGAPSQRGPRCGSLELSGRMGYPDSDSSSTLRLQHKNIWLTSWSQRDASSPPTLDFALACLESYLGTLPIFLHSQHPMSSLDSTFISSHIRQLTNKLQSHVPTTRVFSVFGPTPIVKAFVQSWSALTGAIPSPIPFYAARYTFLTNDTLNTEPLNQPLPDNHRMVLADSSHTELVAILCEEFAEDSVFFPLTRDRALAEATNLINNQQLWVYEVSDPSTNTREVASIVAATRSSENVSAITKVHTLTRWRSCGFARKLVTLACQSLLFDAKKTYVTLYVAHDNIPASRVYGRVGFAETGVPGVEDWVEIGFEDTDRGHW